MTAGRAGAEYAEDEYVEYDAETGHTCMAAPNKDPVEVTDVESLNSLQGAYEKENKNILNLCMSMP